MPFQTQIIIIIILLLVSAFSAMSEAALLSVHRFKVRHWIEKKKFGAVYVKKLKDNPGRFLSALLIINNIVNTAIAAITTSIALRVFESDAIAIATGVAAFFILFFGDIIPKSIGSSNNEVLAPILAPAVWNLSVALYPISETINLLLKALNKLIRSKKIPNITQEELKSILKLSEEEGTIKEIEKKLIQRVFDFENTTASDVMTQKKYIVSVSSDMQLKDVLQLPSAKMYSRIPVYEKNKDNIVGILYIKDMLKHLKEGKVDTTVKQIMKKPFFVFSHRKMDGMLRLFQMRKEHMAIVINEKAQVVGLVTIENILEEIVGEIMDETDRINPSIIQVGKNEWTTRGSTEIHEINAKTGMSIKESDFVDLDSFIVSTLGRYPKANEEISYQNYRIVMEDVQGKKVLQARIFKI